MPRPVLAAIVILSTLPAAADTVLSTGNTIIAGNTCLGYACNNPEIYDIDTEGLRIKQARVRVDFVDSSTGTNLPANDWRLVINDPSFGGADYFGIADSTGGSLPFQIAAGAPDAAFHVENTGDIGLGTTQPATTLHIVDVDNPALRLEQDGSGGFPPQIWEIGGNETRFYVQNASSLAVPFEIKTASTAEQLVLSGDNRVGLGTRNPDVALHLTRDDGTASILIEETNSTAAARGLLTLRNNGQVFFGLEDSSIPAGANSGRQWNFQNLGGTFRVTTAPGGAGEVEMVLDVDGNMTIEGNYFASSGQQLNVPDYVFAPDYDLRPLSEVQAFIKAHSHLPDVPSAAQINATGLNMTDMQMTLLKKVEELTLYALEQQDIIAALSVRLARVETRQN